MPPLRRELHLHRFRVHAASTRCELGEWTRDRIGRGAGRARAAMAPRRALAVDHALAAAVPGAPHKRCSTAAEVESRGRLDDAPRAAVGCCRAARRMHHARRRSSRGRRSRSRERAGPRREACRCSPHSSRARHAVERSVASDSSCILCTRMFASPRARRQSGPGSLVSVYHFVSVGDRREIRTARYRGSGAHPTRPVACRGRAVTAYGAPGIARPRDVDYTENAKTEPRAQNGGSRGSSLVPVAARHHAASLGRRPLRTRSYGRPPQRAVACGA